MLHIIILCKIIKNSDIFVTIFLLFLSSDFDSEILRSELYININELMGHTMIFFFNSVQ